MAGRELILSVLMVLAASCFTGVCTSPGESLEQAGQYCHNGYCLVLVNNRVERYQAQLSCDQRYRGNLVSPRTSEKHVALLEYISRVSEVREVWIGATREWVSNWKSSLPKAKATGDGRKRRGSSGNQVKCGFAYMESSGLRYYDQSCSDKNAELCILQDKEDTTCPDDINQCGSYCLILNKDGVTWYQANQNCLLSGGRLYSSLHAALNLNECMLNEQMGSEMASNPRVHFWVNASNVKWVWPTGEDVGRTFWHKSSPGDYEECAKLNLTDHNEQGSWYGERCDEKLSYVCEYYEKESIPYTQAPDTTSVVTAQQESDLPSILFNNDDVTVAIGDKAETTPTPGTTQTKSDPADLPSPDDENYHHENVFYIVLGTVGLLGILVIVLACALGFYIRKHRKFKKVSNLMDESRSTTSSPTDSHYYGIMPEERVLPTNGNITKPYEKIQSANSETQTVHSYTQMTQTEEYDQIPADYEDRNGWNKHTYSDSAGYVDPEQCTFPVQGTSDSEITSCSSIILDPDYIGRDGPTVAGSISGYLKPTPAVRHSYIELVDPEHNLLSNALRLGDTVTSDVSSPRQTPVNTKPEVWSPRQVPGNTKSEVWSPRQVPGNTKSEDKNGVASPKINTYFKLIGGNSEDRDAETGVRKMLSNEKGGDGEISTMSVRERISQLNAKSCS